MLLVGFVSSVYSSADISVDKSNGLLTISSDKDGIVIAKIFGPDNNIVVSKRYNGSSFSWVPNGPDGTYSYEMRVVPAQKSANKETSMGKGEHTAGMLEVVHGQIFNKKTEGK